MEEIRKDDGTPFGNKGSLVIALNRQGISDTYDAVEKDNGWVGVRKAGETKKQKLTKCRVHRSNCDPDNRDMPISITVNTSNSKKVFWPGQEVELNESQIGVLKDSVEEVRLSIAPESGIYDSQNPMALAKNYFPNMSPELNQATGTITMISRTPNFIIEAI